MCTVCRRSRTPRPTSTSTSLVVRSGSDRTILDHCAPAGVPPAPVPLYNPARRVRCTPTLEPRNHCLPGCADARAVVATVVRVSRQRRRAPAARRFRGKLALARMHAPPLSLPLSLSLSLSLPPSLSPSLSLWAAGNAALMRRRRSGRFSRHRNTPARPALAPPWLQDPAFLVKRQYVELAQTLPRYG